MHKSFGIDTIEVCEDIAVAPESAFDLVVEAAGQATTLQEAPEYIAEMLHIEKNIKVVIDLR